MPYNICLLLLILTLNLSHFPSDWRNLQWWLALVWLVALNTLKYFESESKTRLISVLLVLWESRVTFYLLLLHLTMAGLPHTMPESDEEVQIQVEEVFGFKPCLWQCSSGCIGC